MANSKIVLGNGEVLMDLTADTVKEDKLLKGYTAHGADGNPVTGTCTFDADTKDATATEAEILDGKTSYKNGKKITGTMKNNGGVTGTIDHRDVPFYIPQGFHDGSGTVGLSDAEKAKCISENIREGITLLGIPGGMKAGEGVVPQSKKVTPSFTEQVVLPDAGYTHLSQVTMAAIPVSITDNSAGGKTVTIG